MKTIQEVITRLDEIVRECKSRKSRIGYFAVLYRHVTIRIQDGIINGEFEDNPRMEKLDVIFAERFFVAYEQYTAKKDCTISWLRAFEAADSSRLVALQHLFLGINAHINLDLGIAAAETIGEGNLMDIYNDFNKVNEVLAELVEGVKQNIGVISPVFRWLIPLAKGKDEILLNFSIRIARDGAWKFAKEYFSTEDKPACIRKRDTSIAFLAIGMIRPGFKLSCILYLISLAEWKSIPEVMDQLSYVADQVIHQGEETD